MGLDMYLNKMPRYRGATAKDVSAVEDFLDWLKAKDEGKTDCSFQEWCGRDKVPPLDYINFYSDYYEERYSSWDTEHKYPWARIIEQVGYWRKANSIHNWFVENIQDGEDDCDYHREVTEYDLMELLDICKKVLRNSDLVDGLVNNGYEYTSAGRVPIMTTGKIIRDTSVAEELLPSTSGFFFGSTDYDEYYLDDIAQTIEIIQKVLDTTDFDKEMVYYVSSW